MAPPTASSQGRQVGYLSVSADALRSEFYIVDGDPDEAFTVDKETGLIATRSTVDREKRDTYNLTVVAVQGDKTFSECFVHITIQDLNDIRPHFDVDEPTLLYADGDSAVGQPVHKASVTDDDEGRNALLVFKLEDRSGHFGIDSRGVIFTRRGFRDQKYGNEFKIKVIVEGKITFYRFKFCFRYNSLPFRSR